MKMKETAWPYEHDRRPQSPIVKALQAGVREFRRTMNEQKRRSDIPDPFKESK